MFIFSVYVFQGKSLSSLFSQLRAARLGARHVQHALGGVIGVRGSGLCRTLLMGQVSQIRLSVKRNAVSNDFPGQLSLWPLEKEIVESGNGFRSNLVVLVLLWRHLRLRTLALLEPRPRRSNTRDGFRQGFSSAFVLSGNHIQNPID